MLTPDPAEPDAVALLRRESRSLVQRLRSWTPARYAAAGRADLVHHLAQSLADQAARCEGRPGRRLPRLDADLALADQLAVTSDDLVRARPGAREAVAATCHLLAHRHDLLGEAVPPGLVQVLVPGGDQAAVLAAGAAACRAAAEPAAERSARPAAGPAAGPAAEPPSELPAS